MRIDSITFNNGTFTMRLMGVTANELSTITELIDAPVKTCKAPSDQAKWPEHTCLYCKKTFRRPKKHAKFCNTSCSAKYAHANGVHPKKKKEPILNPGFADSIFPKF